MSQEDFSDFGFSLGVVRGARTWHAVGLDELGLTGQLTGLYYRQPWHPGENVAQCRRIERDHIGAMFGRPGRMSMIPKGTDRDTVFPPIPKRKHMPRCKCGFYGFYDSSNDYYVSDARMTTLVTGMIEGYGEVLIGTRGFRCSKARIVALMIHPQMVLHDFVRDLYPDIPLFHDFETMEREYPNEDGGAGRVKKKWRKR